MCLDRNRQTIMYLLSKAVLDKKLYFYCIKKYFRDQEYQLMDNDPKSLLARGPEMSTILMYVGVNTMIYFRRN